jgi:type IV secretion system protein VirB11
MGGERLEDPRAVRAARLRQKLERELGEVILAALADERVVEVMVNEDGAVWCDRLGDGMALLPETLSADRAASLVGTVAALLDRVANAEQPIVEGELPFFGFRFEGIVPPVSPRATVAIRKRARLVYTIDDYVDRGQLSRFHADVLRKAVAERLNIVVAGGTGSGKTTFVNALLREKVESGAASQRIVILEDTIELQCSAPNKVQLRTCDVVDLARLVRATMRLRPDAIVVGEVRGREALDMLKAWNTGHPGGLTTVHANGARAALSRLDQLVQEAGVPSQPQLLADAVDVIAFIQQRAIQQVVRVHGYDAAAWAFELEELAPPTHLEVPDESEVS